MAVDIFGPGSWEERGGEVVRRLVRDLGLTAEQAAGLVGNLGFESEGFQALQERKPMIAGSRGGYGIAQWTGPRRFAFEDYCRKRGIAGNTDAANYGFLVAELKAGEAAFLAQLRKAATINDATRLAHVLYERPADQSEAATAKRLIWAQQALTGATAPASAQTPADAKTPDPADSAAPDIDIDQLADAIAAKTAITKVVQRLLRDAGYYDGKIDGIDGPNTKVAITAAQKGAK